MSGSTLLSAMMPSTSTSSEPTIQSTWINCCWRGGLPIPRGDGTAVEETFAIGLVESDMARGVLVEQRVKEPDRLTRDY
jgi:hypothetical protein